MLKRENGVSFTEKRLDFDGKGSLLMRMIHDNGTGRDRMIITSSSISFRRF
jgi:hypothetical protein